MTSESKRICKLCSKTIFDSNYKTLEPDNKQILEILLLQVDIESSELCVICMDCLEMLQKCFEFKSACLDVEDQISPFIENGTKIDLVQVVQQDVKISDIKLCRLCLDIVQDDSCKHLDQIENQDLVDDIRNCLPELDVTAVYDPVICGKCISCLKEYSSFQKKYRDCNETNELDMSTNSNANYNLEENKFDVQSCSAEDDEKQYFQIKKELTDECSHDSDCKNSQIKTEVVEMSGIHTFEDIKPEEFDIKPESLEDISVSTSGQDEKWTNDRYKADENISTENDTSAHINSSETEPYVCTICSYRTQYKSHLSRHYLVHRDRPTKSHTQEKYACGICSYETKMKRCFNMHMLVHKDPSEIQWYKCTICNYKSKYRCHLNKHNLSHPRDYVKKPSEAQGYHCTTCNFSTKYKGYLDRHNLLMHTGPSKETYACDLCSYKTEYKHCYKRHMLVHKDPSKCALYKCNTCTFSTIYKHNLTKHNLTHPNTKETQEQKTYSCDLCSYKTKIKIYLKNHSLIHKDLSEIQLYECAACKFTTKYKGGLTKHNLLLHNTSQQTHTCDICGFETKSKYYLRSHMLVHQVQGTKEIQWYKCTTCTFRTRYRKNFKNHNLIHPNTEETHEQKIYTCELCGYKTYIKSYLKRHSFVHRDLSEIQLYRCSTCNFSTKYKRALTKHNLIRHSEKEHSQQTYTCYSCSFTTKRKEHLKNHMLLHENLSEIELYHCATCNFVTKHKSALNIHSLLHTSKETYTCDLCDYKTNMRVYFRRHMSRHKNRLKIQLHNSTTPN